MLPVSGRWDPSRCGFTAAGSALSAQQVLEQEVLLLRRPGADRHAVGKDVGPPPGASWLWLRDVRPWPPPPTLPLATNGFQAVLALGPLVQPVVGRGRACVT